MRVTGWRCAVCTATVDIATPFPWRCPNSTTHDRRHLLQIVERDQPDDDELDRDRLDDVNPYVRYDHEFAWAAYADANGMDLAARRRLVERLDAAVADVAGTGFRPTPFGRSDALSDALGFTDGGGSG